MEKIVYFFTITTEFNKEQINPPSKTTKRKVETDRYSTPKKRIMIPKPQGGKDAVFFVNQKQDRAWKGPPPPPASRQRDEEAGKRGKSPFQFEIMSSDPETPGRARKEAGPAKG